MPKVIKERKDKDSKSSKKKSSKPVKEDVEEEVDVEEEEVEDKLDEIEINTIEQSEPVVNPQKGLSTKESKTPICELNAQQILKYLIKLGEDTLNPTLRVGCQDLLNTLTMRHPPYRGKPIKKNGSKSGSKTNRNEYSYIPMNYAPHLDHKHRPEYRTWN
jgi:hypothetical protein